jgi:hypothetical protein
MEHRFATPPKGWGRAGSPATYTILCLCAVLSLASIAKASAEDGVHQNGAGGA